MIRNHEEYVAFRNKALKASTAIAEVLSKNKLDLSDGTYLLLEMVCLATVKANKSKDDLFKTVGALYDSATAQKERGEL